MRAKTRLLVIMTLALCMPAVTSTAAELVTEYDAALSRWRSAGLANPR
jgi:hypothetical protein